MFNEARPVFEPAVQALGGEAVRKDDTFMA